LPAAAPAGSGTPIGPLSPADALKALTWWRLKMMANRNERARKEPARDRARHP